MAGTSEYRVEVKSESHLPQHIPMDSDAKKHECQECGKCFTLKKYLMKHTLIHRNGEMYKCEQCGKSFAQKSYLKKHIQIHNDAKKHECQQCGRRFTLKYNLKQHILIHNNVKNYECQQCGKGFTLKSILKQHTLVHSDVKSHECQECGKCFTRKPDLMRHTLVHSVVKKHECQECGKCFTRKSDLKQHTLIHSGIKKSGVSWSNLTDEFLVEKIRAHRCLWDHSDESYMKKGLKRVAYNAVASALRENFPAELSSVTADHVRMKFNNLRSYYMRQYKKVTGTASESVGHYIPKWELFYALSFLKDTVNEYTTKASDSFTAEANVSQDTCSIPINEDGTTESVIISLSSSSIYSPMYSSTPSPSCQTVILPPPLEEVSTSQTRAPAVALLSTAMTPKSYQETLHNLSQAKEQNDIASSFGRVVTHWLRGRPEAERMSVAFKLMEVMNNYDD